MSLSLRDRSEQSSIVSCRVSGRSAMTWSVGSDEPPIIATRTRSKPSALTAGSIRRAMAAVSVKQAPVEIQTLPLAKLLGAEPFRAQPQRLYDVEESGRHIGLTSESRKDEESAPQGPIFAGDPDPQQHAVQDAESDRHHRQTEHQRQHRELADDDQIV